MRWDGLWVRGPAPPGPPSAPGGRLDPVLLRLEQPPGAPGLPAAQGGRALVLLPHCIQMARCKADVLTDLGNCYECGLCSVGDLLPLQLERGWATRITNRSHKAYREARDYRPDLIVAVSCSDRLLKGLVKLPEIPCLRRSPWSCPTACAWTPASACPT